MKPEEAINNSILSGLLKDCIGMNPEMLEHFAVLYICEKIRQDMTEKTAAIIGDGITKGLKTVIKGGSQLPEAMELEEELKRGGAE